MCPRVSTIIEKENRRKSEKEKRSEKSKDRSEITLTITFNSFSWQVTFGRSSVASVQTNSSTSNSKAKKSIKNLRTQFASRIYCVLKSVLEKAIKHFGDDKSALKPRRNYWVNEIEKQTMTIESVEKWTDFAGRRKTQSYSNDVTHIVSYSVWCIETHRLRAYKSNRLYFGTFVCVRRINRD